jgi:hypothetical protein
MTKLDAKNRTQHERRPVPNRMRMNIKTWAITSAMDGGA